VELYIFGRFHVRAGREHEMETALREVISATRQEAGCLSIHSFRSVTDRSLFYIHSRWTDDAAFEIHAGLEHTVRFIERVDSLVDQPREVTRARMMG